MKKMTSQWRTEMLWFDVLVDETEEVPDFEERTLLSRESDGGSTVL